MKLRTPSKRIAPKMIPTIAKSTEGSILVGSLIMALGGEVVYYSVEFAGVTGGSSF